MTEIVLPKALQSLGDRDCLGVAARAALVAGQLIMRHFERDIVMQAKSGEDAGYNLVTTADLAAEKIIAQTIREAFPDHSLMGEEELKGDVTAEHLWIIDPIDGTNNFAHGIPHFAVSIAFYDRGVAECGVVLNPARSDWYWSRRGEGSFYQGRKLRVNTHERLDQTMVACGFYYDRGAMMRATLATVEALFYQKIHGIRRLGTAALDFCGVAAGHFGAFFEYRLNPWDFAAARLIVEEAGGRVSDSHGNPLLLQQTGVLVTNGRLHQPVLEVLRLHHPT